MNNAGYLIYYSSPDSKVCQGCVFMEEVLIPSMGDNIVACWKLSTLNNGTKCSSRLTKERIEQLHNEHHNIVSPYKKGDTIVLDLGKIGPSTLEVLSVDEDLIKLKHTTGKEITLSLHDLEVLKS